MGKSDDPEAISSDQTPGPGGTNPFDQGRRGTTSGTGGVNPSAPTAGTEGGELGSNRGDMSVRCSDIHPECNYEARGSNEKELRSQVEQHARERHNLHELGEEAWNKIRNMIRRRDAA